jgi:hypothetical protein
MVDGGFLAHVTSLRASACCFHCDPPELLLTSI